MRDTITSNWQVVIPRLSDNSFNRGQKYLESIIIALTITVQFDHLLIYRLYKLNSIFIVGFMFTVF